MIRPKILFYILYLLSVVSAVVGFRGPQKILVIILFLIYSAIRALFRKKAEFSFLSLSAAFAIFGLLEGAISPLIYLYMGLSIACFDITQMEIRTSGSSENAELAHYRIIRFYPMVIVLSIAFIAVMVLRSFSITFPFALMLFLIIAAFFSINRIIHILKEK